MLFWSVKIMNVSCDIILLSVVFYRLNLVFASGYRIFWTVLFDSFISMLFGDDTKSPRFPPGAAM